MLIEMRIQDPNQHSRSSKALINIVLTVLLKGRTFLIYEMHTSFYKKTIVSHLQAHPM